MNKIVFYKPGKPILFNEENDTAAFSRENVNLINFLLDTNNKVLILSETDNTILKTNKVDFCDILFISNGVLSENEEEYIQSINSKYKILLSTDLTLTKMFNFSYDYILTQTKYDLSNIAGYPKGKYIYAHLEKIFLLNRDVNYNIFNNFNNKKDIIYFAGDERDRTDDMQEYIWNKNNVIWNGKSHTLNIRNKVSIKEVEENYKKYKYTIVIADKEYNKYNFVTQRFYEASINGVIPFLDSKFDQDNLILAKNHFLRVNNYKELNEKINYLQKNDNIYQFVINDIIKILQNAKNDVLNFLINFMLKLQKDN